MHFQSPIRHEILNKKACFIYCIERGLLEDYTILSIATLRQFGGLFADVDIFCFQPRKEFGISAKTKARLNELDVQFIDYSLNTSYRYYSLANKPIVCAYAEKHFSHDRIIFVDSDTMVLEEPHLFLLSAFQFFICKNYLKGIGVSSALDPDYSYWRTLYQLCKSDIKSQSTIVTHLDRQEILSYWNSAIFCFDRKISICSKWLDLVKELLNKRIQPESSIYFVEESALSVVLQTNKIKLKEMPIYYNFPINEYLNHNPEIIQRLGNNHSIKIIHHLDNIPILMKLNSDFGLIPDKKMAEIKHLMNSFGIFPASEARKLQRNYLRKMKSFKEKSFYFKWKIQKQLGIER